MRLLRLSDSGKLSLTTHDLDKLPPYAILSHTWGTDEDEVSFTDLVNNTGKSKAGHAKIVFCGERASEDGLKDFWVDTCCIDKRNYTELSEAIISMFRWYQKAAKCYVYLSDVSASKHDRDGCPCDWKDAFRKSRWFTRGWTLQELLAPKELEFWSRDGHRLGTKETLKDLIHDITGIPPHALLGAPMSGFSAFERMRWAAKRETKKAEDKFYCLFGIFDVSLPILYGEGSDKASDRLMTEINRLQGPIRELANDNPGAETRRVDLLGSLAFDQMDSRHSTIKDAQRSTCEWILQHPDYVAWDNTDTRSRGILWIAGKPGAGKSTLVKFALAHARQTIDPSAGEIILDFFFNARGHDLEKTTLGMYRALLAQLFDQASDLRYLLDHVNHSKHEDSPSASTWTIGILQNLLRDAVMGLGARKMKVFIDALDECDEEEVRDMVEFLEDLGESDRRNQISICFASRHYPSIEVRHSWRLVLEDEEGHADDLSKYIERRLQAGKGKKIERIRAQVQEKANGVFMWVVLVVGVLNDAFRRGRIFAVEQRLREIPTELSELFKDILRRDNVHMDELLLCLQWILFAKRPLSREEFYFALEAGLHPCPEDGSQWQPQPWDSEEITHEDMARFVLNSSKGLAELTRSKKAPTVQFIHESVRDFLLRDGGMQELWPHELGGDFMSRSHDKLWRCCSDYLTADLLAAEASSEGAAFRTLPKAEAKALRQKVTNQFPFIQYAHEGVLYHAESTSCEFQQIFFRAFPLEKWTYTHNILEPHNIRRYSDAVSLVYILADNGYSQLIRTLQPRDVWVRCPSERHQVPVLAAFAGGHRNSLQSLLGDDSITLVETLVKEPGFGKYCQWRSNQTPLEWAASNRNWALAECLLIAWSGKTPQNTMDAVLEIAASHGTTNVIKFLLDAGAKFLHAYEYNGMPPMDPYHYTKLVQMSLDEGHDPGAQPEHLSDELHTAPMYDLVELVEKFRDAGIDVQALQEKYGNALQTSQSGHYNMMQILLDAEAASTLPGLGRGYRKRQILDIAVRWALDKLGGNCSSIEGADSALQPYRKGLQETVKRCHEKVFALMVDAAVRRQHCILGIS